MSSRPKKLPDAEEQLLDEFRNKKCEWCGYRAPSDAAHIYSRGAGYANIRENIVALCRLCHTKNHAANSINGIRPNREDLKLIASLREGVLPESIEDAVYAERRRRLRKS